MKIHLPTEDLNVVQNILKAHFPHAKMMIFGSRVRGDHEKYSDLDVAIDNKKEISFSDMAKIKESFSESNLAILVDIVDFQSIDEKFQNHILKNCFLLDS